MVRIKIKLLCLATEFIDLGKILVATKSRICS